MITPKDLRKGSIIEVRGDFGQGPQVLAQVDFVDRDVRTGAPVVDYTNVNNRETHWAFFDQIDSVLRF